MHFRRDDLFGFGTIGVPPQRWAVTVTWAAILAPVPSILWRCAMISGVPTGFAEAGLFRGDPAGIAYVLGLCVVEVLVSLACWGLIRPWGEKVPALVPILGGRVIPRWAPTLLGTAGTLLLAAITGALLSRFLGSWIGGSCAWTPTDGMSTPQALVLVVLYAPFFAWPLLIGPAVLGYWLRRRPG